MMTAARRYWDERSPREQWMLAVMFTLLGGVLLWFAILRPLWGAKAAAQARFDRATQSAGEVAAAADALRDAASNAPRPLTTTLPLTISQSAAAAGFTLTTLEPQGDGRVAIAIPAAKAPALFAWLGELAGSGIVVERLTLRTGADGALGVEAGLRGPR